MNVGKAIKCTACGSFYNGSIYSNCPYCSENSTKSSVAPTSENSETKGVFGRFGKNKNAGKATEKTAGGAVSTLKPVASEPVREPAVSTEKDIQIQHQNVRRATEPLFQNQTIPATVPMVVSKQEATVKSGNDSGLPLSQAISRSGRTVGKYISSSSGESVAPVVGWLVGVKGAYHGQSFNLKSGRNKIGRSHEMDVKLLNDDSVSRSSVAVIIFDAKASEFSLLPGESDSLCYVNNKAVYDRVVLSGYERIEFGDAGLNQYIFVPFCGPRFSWSSNVNT